MSKKIYNSNKNSLLKHKFLLRVNSSEGFALPQILLLAIGLSISLVSLLNVSINRLSTSKISNKEMQAKNAADSAFNNVRTLFNNSKSGAYYYYWLLKSCSFKVPSNQTDDECPEFAGGRYGNQWPGELKESYGRFRDPSKTFWSDANDIWCAGNSGRYTGKSGADCEGRPVAPSCETLGKGQSTPKDIKWSRLTNSINHLLGGSEKTIESTTLNSNIQKFYIKSTDYMGDETGNNINSLVFEGLNYSSKNRLKATSANKIRAGVKISRNVTEAGFGFLSVGENYNDDKSLFLGDFQIKKPVRGEKKGSIIWRKHINPNRDFIECKNIRSQSGIRNVNNLPDASKQNGGIWVQPLLLPNKPKYDAAKGNPGGEWMPGDVVCLTETNTNSCTFLENRGFTSYQNEDRTFQVDNLVVRGKDSYFGVVTSDDSKVYLHVNGSVDVSNGGNFCHIDKSKRTSNAKDRCGSGNPENLIIVFDQVQPKPSRGNPAPPEFGKERLSCSADGGINYAKSSQPQPLHRNNIPYNTLNLASTGNKDESFSAFVYATDTTFSTASPKTDYYSVDVNGGPFITTKRGVYAYMKEPSSPRSVERLPVLIRNIYDDLIPYTYQPDKKSWNRRVHGLGDTYIIAVGRRNDVPSKPDIDILMRDMALVWDSVTKKYFLIGLYESINNLTKTQEMKFAYRDRKDTLSNRTLKWKIDLGRDPFKRDASRQDRIIDLYKIDLSLVRDLPKDKNFKGSSWVKNACFDKLGKTTWDFDSKYPERLTEKLGTQYYFGVPYYRGKFIQSWDTLRSNK